MKIEDGPLDNSIKLIRLAGRLDMSSALLIEDEFTSLVAAQSGPVLVDLAEVDFIASIGIRLLISNAKNLAKGGGRMVLAGAQPMVEKTLKTLGVNELIPMYENQAAAMVALKV